jgi:hypothetical protein
VGVECVRRGKCVFCSKTEIIQLPEELKFEAMTPS